MKTTDILPTAITEKMSDIKLSPKAITDLEPEEDGDKEENMHEHLLGAERFMTLQNKVMSMMPHHLFPKSANEFLELSNLIYNNVKDLRSDIPRNVITRWEYMAPKRREREVENPYKYT